MLIVNASPATSTPKPISFTEQLAAAAPLSGKTVLVVDDHVGMRTSLRITLSNCGITAIDMAGNATEGVRRISTRKYDIIVCDYNLGNGRNGQQLLEELRHESQISMSTCFLMVTAEQGYERVVAAAELAPDDYLIKPFTADALKLRLERALQKKAVFAQVYVLMEAGSFDKAFAECEAILANKAFGKYAVEALRMKAEIRIAQEQLDEAKAIYEKILLSQAVPWARMGLAKIMFRQMKFDDAEPMLSLLVEENPEFLSACDLLAEVREALGNSDGSQSVLEIAAQKSPNNIKRQKLLGDTAYRNGDCATAETAYSEVLSRGKYSAFLRPEDYANLARVQLEQGRLDEATSTIGRLRGDSSLATGAEAQIVAASIAGLIAAKHNDNEAAESFVQQAMALAQGNRSAMSEQMALDLANCCFAAGMQEEGEKVMRDALANNHDSSKFLDRAKKMLAEVGKAEIVEEVVQATTKEVIALNNQGVRLAQSGDIEAAAKMLMNACDRLPHNLQLNLNAAQCLLSAIEKLGWDEKKLELAKKYIGHAKARDPNAKKLADVHAKMLALSKKFGFAT